MSDFNINYHELIRNDDSDCTTHSRICMLSSRNIYHNAFRCGFFEAQDILKEIDHVDFLELKPKRGCRTRQEIHQYFISKDFTKRIVRLNSAFQPIKIKKEYDLFVAHLPIWTDLIQISAIRRWKENCRTSLCWLDEFWTSGIKSLDSYVSILSEFDYVVLGLEGTIDAMSDAIGIPCHWVPIGVDTIRFSPYPDLPSRVIDIYSIGRIWPDVHNSFLNFAAKNGLFYIYDTFHAADTRILNYRMHRAMMANMIKRCKYFYVAPAKMDISYQSKGQMDVGARYYEGAASGAVMVGHIPDCKAFKTMFHWPDSVIEVGQDGSDVSEILTSLNSQPDRLLKISHRNVVEALLRHDWVYRWKKILEIAGLKPLPQLEIREKRLERIARKMQEL